MPPSGVGVPAGKAGVAMADREQALGDGVTAARVTLLVAAATHPARRTPDRAQQAPGEYCGDRDDAERQRKHRYRRLGAQSTPVDDDVAGLIGNPGRAGTGECNQNKEEDDAKHDDPYTRSLLRESY